MASFGDGNTVEEVEGVEARVARLRRDYELKLEECRQIISNRDNTIEMLQRRIDSVHKICDEPSENFLGAQTAPGQLLTQSVSQAGLRYK